MGGGEVQVTLSGELVQRMREVLPTGTMTINKRAEKIIAEWVNEKAAEKEAAELRRILKKGGGVPWQVARKGMDL